MLKSEEYPISSFEIPDEEVVLGFSELNIIPETGAPVSTPSPTKEQRSDSKTVSDQRNSSNWLQKLIIKVFGKS